MKPKHPAALLVLLGALVWAGAARAQSEWSSNYFWYAPFYCESYLVYDPTYSMISGYSRTFDYENEGYQVGVQAYFYDPNNIEYYSEDMGEYEEAEADVYSGGPPGNYWIYGEHWGVGADWGCCEYYLGETVTNLYKDPPTVTACNIAAGPWYAGSANLISVSGTYLGGWDATFSNCPGDVSVANWSSGYSYITEYVDVLPNLSQSCTLGISLLTCSAGILLMPAPPPPPPTLTCTPPSVTRGDSVTCTVSNASAGSVSGWSFTGGGATIQGGGGTLSSSGTMVVSGTVSVTITGLSTPLSAEISVTPRSWHTATPNPVLNTTIVLATPPQTFGDLGSSVPAFGNFSYSAPTTITAGPNTGFTYYTTPLTFRNLSFTYNINSDLQNQSSTFSQHQCGNYNLTSSPYGYISWSDLDTQTIRHEYNSNTQSHWAFFNNSMNANNPGDFFETQVAVPNVSASDFNSATNAGVSALGAQILSDAEVQPYGCNYSETGVFLGNVNWIPYVTYPQ